MPKRAASRAWPKDLAGCPPPQGASSDAASAVSFPQDGAAAGNDAAASTAPAPGGEAEPHSRHRDSRLRSTDKELKAGATAAGSAPTSLGTPGQRVPQVEVMDPGLWGHGGEGYMGNFLSLARKDGQGPQGERVVDT